jgi:NADPH:quinone reductase
MGIQGRIRHDAAMRAIVLTSYSGLEALELREVPDPEPSEGEEVVRVRAAALGPWDLGTTQGAFAEMGGSGDFPQVVGWDFAGETQGGRRVLGFVAQPWMGVGSLAERVSVPSALLASLPEGVGWEEAATIPVCALTAQLLVEGASVSAGDLVLVIGAAGMVGGFALQLAKARQARVVAVLRADDADEARALGADEVVESGDELEVDVRGRWTDGVDACLDTVGLGERALACVRDGGAFRTSVPSAVPEAARGIAPEAVQVQPDAATAEEMARAAADGRLTLRVAKTLPMQDFRRGYELLAGGGLRGKVVITP